MTEGKIGVLGGTFDPVHKGHLAIAAALREALDLDRVIWVPAGRPPHKQGQIVSEDVDRLEMLRLALDGSTSDLVSTADLDRGGPSYTADLLEILARDHAPDSLVFLMGEDSLRDLPTWHDPERILEHAELAVAARPGIETDLEAIERAVPAARGRVHLVPTEEIPISSSDIRERVRSGQPIAGLVPRPVAEYIAKHRLYRSSGSR